MPPQCPCLHYTTSISFSITLSSSYLCWSPTMTAVLSSVAGLLDRCSLNSSDMSLLTRVTTNDFYLPLWKTVVGFFWLRGPFYFWSKIFQVESGSRPLANSLEAQPSWLHNREKGYDGYDGLSHEAGRALKDCSVNHSAPLPSPYLPRVPYQGEVAPLLTLWERLSVSHRAHLLLAIVCHS